MIFDLILDPIIDFNSWRMISSVSGRYLGKRLLDFFSYCTHTHALGGVDVPFGGHNI